MSSVWKLGRLLPLKNLRTSMLAGRSYRPGRMKNIFIGSTLVLGSRFSTRLLVLDNKVQEVEVHQCANSSKVTVPERFDELYHIQWRCNDEAIAMLTKELAQQFVECHGTLLHNAVYHDNVEIAEKLIELGADVNRHGGRHRTPLSIALKNGSEDVVRVLLEAGARLDIVNDDGSSALQLGLDWQPFHFGAFKLLVKQLRTLARTNEELAEFFIRTGCNMCHAASLRDVDLMECMLQRGVDVNSKDTDGKTALHVMADMGDVALAEWLLNKGADVNALDDHGLSPLSIPALKGYKAMMKLLLDRGADPNAERESGGILAGAFFRLDLLCKGIGIWAYILWWIFRRRLGFEKSDDLGECAELLLQHGARLPSSGKKILDMFYSALFYSHDGAIKLLIAHMAMLEMIGEPVDKSVLHATINGYEEKMSELWKYYVPCRRILYYYSFCELFRSRLGFV